MRVASGTEAHSSLVMTRAHKDQLGTELSGEREDEGGEEGDVVSVIGPINVKGDVYMEATPPARPYCVTLTLSILASEITT